MMLLNRDQVKTKKDIIEVLQQSKAVLNQRFGVEELGLFGSYAKDAQHEESDIDIVYHLKEGATLGLLALIDMEEFMKLALEVDRVDLVNKRYLNPVIALDIDDSLIYV